MLRGQEPVQGEEKVVLGQASLFLILSAFVLLSDPECSFFLLFNLRWLCTCWGLSSLTLLGYECCKGRRGHGWDHLLMESGDGDHAIFTIFTHAQSSSWSCSSDS